MLSTEDWHKRYQNQGRWTEQVRRYLFKQVNLGGGNRVLEVGCGTGAITSDIYNECKDGEPQVFGIDNKINNLKFAIGFDRKTYFSDADAYYLPFAPQTMDATICHFLLLWLKIPLEGIMEMRRVTRKGGVVLALAEPDFKARIDYPQSLEKLGLLQADALRGQGADPVMGRQLSVLFHQAGLINVQTGLLGGEWSKPPSTMECRSEWAVLKNDLAGTIPDIELKELIQLDSEAWHKGERVLFVPTFYAIGYVA